jgi:hypothetical protein
MSGSVPKGALYPAPAAALTVDVVTGDVDAAAINAENIQAALNIGGLVYLIGSGLGYISGRLVIKTQTHLVVSKNLQIIQAPTANGTNVLVNECVTRNWTSVTLNWSSGLTMTVNWTAHGKSVGDAVWVDGQAGTTDSAFMGVFPVLSITNANSFVVGLRRLPGAAPAGTIQAKLADRNIVVEGGIWNQNYLNVGFQGFDYREVGVILAGIMNLTVRDVVGTQCAAYCFYSAGVVNFLWDGVATFDTNKDGLKIFGPAWDGIVANQNLQTGDDGFSIHSDDGSGFESFNLSTGLGDALNIKVINTRVKNTLGTAIILFPGENHVMDQIEIDGVSGETTDTLVNIKGAQSASHARRIIVKNVQWENPATLAIAVAADPGNTTVDHLIIDGFTTPADLPNSFTSYPIAVSTNAAVKYMETRNLAVYYAAVNYYAIGIQTGAVDTLVITDSYFACDPGGQGSILLNSSTIDTVIIKNVRAKDLIRLVENTSDSPTNYYLHDNFLWTAQGVNFDQATGGGAITIKDNEWFNTYQGAVRGSTTGTVTINSANNLYSGAAIPLDVGSTILQVFGWDFPVDVTKIARVNGSYCFNTNAAAGTLGAAGLVSCQGTAANSWHLLADPTKTY